MLILILISIYILILYLEVPDLLKKRWYRELGIFSLFFLLGLYLSLAQFFGWPLVNPFQPVITFMSKG